ncbi:MORN repeat protein [Flavobacterium limnosediminis JC2902]|uniref:MORN repeat protein n=1 Tax=Flavobacterium limnosediminis JC2902 TaxID=1341181 RepID=V6SWP0_9FLAO|nr:MORN repeat protein [Flavobacterium limnosediminis]ESU28830.1 MORN repeat protein [Flavobacterium limnosediminis JC2902]
MKKIKQNISFILLLTLWCSVIYGQNINKFDESGKRHGLWKGVYEDTKNPRYEGTFEHGKETGVFKYFDNTVKLVVIATRDFSANDGSHYTTFYNQKGFKVSEGKVVGKDTYVGEWKYYHLDSKKIMTLENYVDGKLNGVRKVYFPNDKIAEETTYVNGKKEGKYKKYADNGVVLEESNYKNDQYDGMATFRISEKQISGQGMFKNGKKVGKWKVLENGKLKTVNMDLQGKKFEKRTKPVEDYQGK